MPRTTVDPPPDNAPARRHRPVPSPAVAAGLVAAVLLFGSWALLDGPRRVPGWEADAFHAVNDLPDALEWPLLPVMQLGTLWMASVAGVVAWLLTRRAGPALGAVLAVTGAWLVARLVKGQVGRPRPDELLADVEVREPGVDGNGYVSGHATVAFAVATVLTPLLPRRWRALPLTLACVVALARVYFGVHLPLDVAGGAAVGILGGLVAVTLTRRPGTGAGPGR